MADLSLFFSPEVLQEARLVAELENKLMQLSESNYDEVFTFIKESIFIENETRIKQLANHIIFGLSKRYMIIPLYSRLTCDLYDLRLEVLSNDSSNIHQALSFLHTVFFPIIIPSNVDSRTLYFLYFCVVGSLFSAIDIINILHDSLEKEPGHISELLTLFCFFAPEVEELDPTLFELFIQTIKMEAQNVYCQPYVRQFCNEMDDLCSDNWALLKSRRETMTSGDIIIDSLFTDSLDDFQNVVSHSPHFDLNQNINESIFSPPHMFSKTLIQFAARCGSAKCFKFLLLNKADLHEAVDSAIIGGNNEIVRLLKQYGCNFKGSLGAAAKAHRNAIFHWLEVTDYPVCQNNIDNDIEAVFGAVEACNMPLLLELLERGIDINLKSHTNESILSASIALPMDAFSLLIHHKAFQQVNMMNQSGEYSPLSIAVDRRVSDVVEYYYDNFNFQETVIQNTSKATSVDSTATITRQQQQKRQQHLVEDCTADGFAVVGEISHLSSVPKISDKDRNLVLIRPFNLDNIIHQAAFQGDKQIMEMILKFPGINVNSVNRICFFLIFFYSGILFFV